MALFPVTTCAHLLGIHPKTLQHWLKEANLPVVTHPTDARIKCLTQDHLQEVARRHDRSLPQPPWVSISSEEQAPSLPPHEMGSDRGTCSASAPSLRADEPDVIQKLSCLETKVVTLQEQLAQLAIALLQERERVVELRITALEALVQQLLGKPTSDAPPPETEHTPACGSQQVRQLLPAEQLARSRMPPLIEYSAQGTYVILSSQEGELHLVPDSAQWFDWLATISSFRFIGPDGRFTACRESKGGRGWIAHRSVHQRRYKRYLGVTDRLTIVALEQTAATLLPPVSSL